MSPQPSITSPRFSLLDTGWLLVDSEIKRGFRPEVLLHAPGGRKVFVLTARNVLKPDQLRHTRTRGYFSLVSRVEGSYFNAWELDLPEAGLPQLPAERIPHSKLDLTAPVYTGFLNFRCNWSTGCKNPANREGLFQIYTPTSYTSDADIPQRGILQRQGAESALVGLSLGFVSDSRLDIWALSAERIVGELQECLR